MNIKLCLRIIRLRNFKALLSFPPRIAFCYICNNMRVFLSTDKFPLIGWRCLSCRATPYHNAAFKKIREIYFENLSGLSGRSVYELSAHGAIYNALKKHSKKVGFNFFFSEFLENYQLGHIYKGIRCEDVQTLTFPNDYFDLITSSSVFEHVEDDIAGFREIARTLKPGGLHIFTVPFDNSQNTIIRAKRFKSGAIEHFETPEYHSDPYRGEGGVFTWRNYGNDIYARIASAGLKTKFYNIELTGLDKLSVPVFVSRKSTTIGRKH